MTEGILHLTAGLAAQRAASHFVVYRIPHPSGDPGILETYSSRSAALRARDTYRAAPGYDRRYAHVGVVDLDDPEWRDLDW